MPHWERGYRCHGYWLDDLTRIGVVTIGPPGLTKVKRDGYGWLYQSLWTGKETEGSARTLKEGKTIVEKMYANEKLARTDQK